MKKFGAKFLVIAIAASAIYAYFAYDLGQYLTFEQLKENRAELEVIYQQHKVWFISVYFLSYVIMAAVSLPGATVMSLAGGAVFGVATGTIVVSFASTIGATLAMLASRFLIGQDIQNKYGNKLKTINQGIAKEGGFYLFSLRLIPLFPFFMINLVMGLTRFPAWKFYWISQIGMLPGTLAYINAGTRLAELESASGILSMKFILSFAALGVLPLVFKRIIDFLRAK